MSGHTRGPWRIFSVNHVSAPSYGIISSVYGNSVHDRAANARLIAAAPELLAASKRTVKALTGTSAESYAADVLNELSEAIWKAEGTKP